MYLTSLVHFEEEGWAILANVVERDRLMEYEFMTLSKYNDKPRVFYTPTNSVNKKARDICQVKYEEVENQSPLCRGNTVYYFINNRQFSGKRGVGKVRHGKITSINHETGNVVIDNAITVKLLSVMTFEHNFQEIEGTDAFICDKCRSLLTPKQTQNIA